jgi:DegV family protein with EDD domain
VPVKTSVKIYSQPASRRAFSCASSEFPSRACPFVDTLEYLHRGGRLSKTAAAVGELANLKPTLSVAEGAGTVNVIGKSLGKNKALQNLLKQLSTQTVHPGFPVYTIYSYGTDNCERFEARLQETGIVVDARFQIGPSIGSHVGPEVFGIVYVTQG